MKFITLSSLLLLLLVGLAEMVASQAEPGNNTEDPTPTTTTTTTAPTHKPTTTTVDPTTPTDHPTTKEPTTQPPPTSPPTPTSSSSTTTTTTTPKPSPKPNPAQPALGHYNITKPDGEICLVLQTRLTVTNNDTKSIPFGEGEVCTSASQCYNDSIELWLNFTEPEGTVWLNFTKNSTWYFISGIGVDVKGVAADRENLRQFEVATNKFYKCSQPSEVNLEHGVHLIFSDMKYEAFRTSKTIDFVGSEQECAPDYHSDVVIIAIGCALALLVVIILVAYLIARRKNRQRGYQSV